MRTQFLFKTLSRFIILVSFQFGFTQNIQVKSLPNEPGERKATSIAKLLGIPLKISLIFLGYPLICFLSLNL